VFSHLTPSQRAALRRRMTQRLQVLRGEVSAGLHDVEAPAAALERDARELNEITEALARLDSREFGLCVDCGLAITWPRLNAEPQTQRCIACQMRFEREHPKAVPEL
jgi:RNA polymerase-binding transcription factor DksA